MTYIVFVIYLGVYTFNNPDPKNCFFIDGLDKTAPTKLAAVKLAADRDIPVKSGYPVDMAHIFRGWFIWGFLNQMYQISVIIVFTLIALICKSKMPHLSIIYTVFQSMSCLISLLWIAMGMFWRFSKAGTTASGGKLERAQGVSDFAWEEALEGAKITDGTQLQGGKFMHVFLMIIVGTVLLAVAIVAIYSIVIGV